MIIDGQPSPEMYRAIGWWKTNIGLTNPNWNLLFYRIYAGWMTNTFDFNSLSLMKSDSLGSDFINEANETILSYCFDFLDESGVSLWAYNLSFVLTCFYFLHNYHEYYFSILNTH